MRDQVARSDYKNSLLSKLSCKPEDGGLAEPPFDALLCPSMPFPAPPVSLGSATYLTTAYACISNLVGLPSGSVPVTRVAEGEDVWDPVKDGGEPEDTLSADIRSALKGSVGLPMGVQVIAPAFREECVLRLMREIENAATH